MRVVQQLLDIANTVAAQYASLVNILLTTFIVCLTGWYAFVTRRMWREMVEARRASIRPILDVRVAKPALDESHPDHRRDLSSSVQISNHGRGPAYAVRSSVHLRYETEQEQTWIRTDVDLPSTIAPGNSGTAAFTIHGFPTAMNEHRADFLMLEVSCRDAEGHSYMVTQTYDLRAFDLGNVISRTWQLRREDIQFAESSRKVRSTFEDEDDQGRTEVLRSRRIPRGRDWTR